jgi:hypothetical protein
MGARYLDERRGQLVADRTVVADVRITDVDGAVRYGCVVARRIGEGIWIVISDGLENSADEQLLGCIEETRSGYLARHGDADAPYTFTTMRAALAYFDEYAYVARLFRL